MTLQHNTLLINIQEGFCIWQQFFNALVYEERFQLTNMCHAFGLFASTKIQDIWSIFIPCVDNLFLVRMQIYTRMEQKVDTLW